jgi:hypothetical protein
MTELLDPTALGAFLGGFQHHLFRMETLPQYAVDSDGDDYQRWLDGEPEPTWERLNGWLKVLRDERAAKKISARVRVLSAHLTDYERYACEFGYQYTGEAGEDIRVLRRGEHTFPSELIDRDFWIVDGAKVIDMHYDEHGRFLGAELLGAGQLNDHLRAHAAAWAAAEPFAAWWARHPELHRRLAA